MSDVPEGAGWWYAADGKWYPPPFPTDPEYPTEYPSTPPTPAPDHPPTAMVRGASGFPIHTAEVTPHPTRSKALWAVSAVAIILAIAVVTLALALVGRGPGNVRTASQEYDLVISDVLDAEDINVTFLDTFWQTYATFVAQWRMATPDQRTGLTEQFLDEVDAEIAQFRLDLQSIDGALVSRAFDDGTDADRIRDAAVAHYRTWDDWADEVPTAARSWTAAGPSRSLDEWIDDRTPQLGDAIDTTFHEVCHTLSAEQPSDGSYESTIAEICS